MHDPPHLNRRMMPDAVPSLFERVLRGLSLSRIQSIVAILAGSATVLVAAISLAQAGPSMRTGTLIAVVRGPAASPTVADATVDVLTPDNALVASVTPDANGRVAHALREGVYLVRISKPRCAVDVRRVQVQAGQTVEIKATLRPGSSTSVDRSLNKGVNAIRRALGVH